MAQPQYNKAQGNNAMPCGYPIQTSPTTNQVFRRSLTNSDIELFSNLYASHQKRLRGLAIMSLGLAVISTFLLSGIIIVDSTISLVLYIATFIIGLVSIGMSLNMFLVKKRISDTLQRGTVIEVHGPAYRNRIAPNNAAWIVGPILIMGNPGNLNMIQEGMQTKVLCSPRMNMVLSINNVGLRHGARMMYPPNLEMMAVPAVQIAPTAPPQEADAKKETDAALEPTVDNSMNSDERLIKLKELKDKGLITEEDYENKKKEILVNA